MLSREEKIQHYNDLMQLCTCTDAMLKWIDEYRKRKNQNDKNALFAARDYETEIRKLLVKIQNDNNILVNPIKTKAA